MAALAAKAVKDQRKKAANQKIEQALNNVNEQRNALTYVAQKHRADSLSSLSTLDSFRPEDPNKTGRPPRPRRPDDSRRRSKLDKGENEDGVYQASGSANIILYVGLGMISIGLVITFVGLGDKGFRTLELKLIGPSLVGCGVFFALLRVLFCTVPSCCRACCKCCRKTEDTEELIYATDDPPPKTGYAVGNSTNMSATYTDSRKVGPTNGVQKSGRTKSGKAKNDRVEEAEIDGDFQNKTLKSAKPRKDRDSKGGTASGSGSGGAAAKPISYDTYSTDTSSQFSVDIVEVAPRGLELEETGDKSKNNPLQTPTAQQEDGGESAVEENGTEIVLNASRLQVESEK